MKNGREKNANNILHWKCHLYQVKFTKTELIIKYLITKKQINLGSKSFVNLLLKNTTEQLYDKISRLMSKTAKYTWLSK